MLYYRVGPLMIAMTVTMGTQYGCNVDPKRDQL